MRIALITGGSRGDVQPYVALGKGLQAAGHTVQVLATQDYQELVATAGLDFVATGGSVQVTASQVMQDLIERGNTLEILAATGRGALQLAQQSAASGLAACHDVDLIVAGLGGLFVGLALAEKLDKPLIQAHLLPFAYTRQAPSILIPLPPSPLTRWANGPSHQLTQQMLWQMFREADNQVRTQVLHMARSPLWGPGATLRRPTRAILHGYSPQVVPPPSDWPDSTHVTGYWFLDQPAGWQPPSDLVEFLQSGPPPVYVGFGSMPGQKPVTTADIVLQALTRTGQRGLLSSGWGGLKPEHLPQTALLVGAVPHDWLFARVAAVVHHGGAGTTAAGLRAGVPSIIAPFFGDQPYWGRRVFDLGVGPRPIPRPELTVERLAERIQTALSDNVMRRNAANLSERIRAEDGVARAVSIVERAMA